MNQIANIIHHNINMIIEYEETPITREDAWKPCGNGTWVYDSKNNTIGRNNIGFCHELPYGTRDQAWNPNGRFHKILSSTHPLWVWWKEGCRQLKWGDENIALPKLNLN